jgi:hypothetical protein
VRELDVRPDVTATAGHWDYVIQGRRASIRKACCRVDRERTDATGPAIALKDLRSVNALVGDTEVRGSAVMVTQAA